MELMAVLILLCVVMIAQNLLYRKLAFAGVSYSCRFSTNEAAEGDEITLVEEIVNNKLLPLPWLKAEITTSRFLEFAGSQSLVTEDTRFVPSFFMMRSYQKVTRTWKVKCLKRGVYGMNRIVLVATDLLGNVNASKVMVFDQTLTVLPRPVDLTADFPTHLRMTGDHIVKRHLIADPFMIAGVREYTDRDSMNRIHWPASARTGQLMVHNNEYTADQSIAMILNMQSRAYEGSSTMDRDKIEDAIHVCAGYLDDTLRSGIPVSLYSNGCATGSDETVLSPEYWGREHVLELLRTLARLDYRYADTFHNFLETTCRDTKASDIVLITAFLSEEILNYAGEMQRMGRRVMVVHIGKLPENLEYEVTVPLFEFMGGELHG